jgi:hypothetical protein
VSRRDPSPPLVLTPAPDGAGGALVTLPPGTSHARIVGSGLSAIELRANAPLRVLDLRECAEGLHFTFEAEGPLERVILPPGRGACLVVRLASAEVGTVFEGPVRSFSLAWPSSREAGRERGIAWSSKSHAVLQGLQLGPSSSPPEDGVEAWIAVGGRLDRSTLDVVDATALWLLECVAPEGVVVTAPLTRLDLIDVDTPSLTFATADRVRIRPCRELSRVSGHTPLLLLREGAPIGELVIEGQVEQADLLDVHCATLRILGCSRLRLEKASGIRRLETLSDARSLDLRTQGPSPELVGDVRQRVVAPTPQQIEQQFVQGSAMGRDAMIAWAVGCGSPNDLETALRVFASAIDTGAKSSAAMWKLRDGLHTRHTMRTKDRSAWAWPFPEDQALRGYETDLFLWLRYFSDHTSEALERAESFVSSGSPANVASLLFVAARSDVDDDERDSLIDLARRACERGAELGVRLDVPSKRPTATNKGRLSRADPVGLSRTDLTWIDLALHALLNLASHRSARTMAEAMSRWIVDRAPTEEGVRVLGRLAAHGCEAARQGLARILQGLARRVELDASGRSKLQASIAKQWLIPAEIVQFGGTHEPRCERVAEAASLQNPYA